MELVFSDGFAKSFDRIRERALKERVVNKLRKVCENPAMGKPLQHQLKGYRSIRIPPFRIIYRLEGERIIVNTFDHRKDVYD